MDAEKRHYTYSFIAEVPNLAAQIRGFANQRCYIVRYADIKVWLVPFVISNGFKGWQNGTGIAECVVAIARTLVSCGARQTCIMNCLGKKKGRIL